MKIYYVDLPNPRAISQDDSWTNVAVCGSEEEAFAVLYIGWGLTPKQCAPFITEGVGELTDLYVPDFVAPEDSRL